MVAISIVRTPPPPPPPKKKKKKKKSIGGHQARQGSAVKDLNTT